MRKVQGWDGRGMVLRGVGFSSRQAVSIADLPRSGRLGRLPAWWRTGTDVTHKFECMEVRILANSLWVIGLWPRVEILELCTKL